MMRQKTILWFCLNSPQNGKSNFLERWRYFANGWAHNHGKHLFKNVKQCFNSSNQDFIFTPHRIGFLSFYFSPFESVHHVQSHAQRIHNLVIEKISPVSELQKPKPPNNQPKETPAKVLAHLATSDRIPFATIALSIYIQKALGRQIPSYGQGVMKEVMSYVAEMRGHLILQLSHRIANNEHFSVSFDEYTAPISKRYICLNVHCQDHEIYSLREKEKDRQTDRLRRGR